MIPRIIAAGIIAAITLATIRVQAQVAFRPDKLQATTAPATTDKLGIAQGTAQRGVTLENFFKVINTITAKAVPTNADKVVIYDAAGGASKSSTLAQILTAGNTNVGAAAGTGVVATEYGNGTVHQTVLTCTNVAVALSDNAGVVAYGGLKIYDFPAGSVLIMGAVPDISLTKSSAGVNDNWDGDFGLGTVTATNDATLATTEQNLLPTTATPQAAAGVTTSDGKNAAVAFLDGTTTAVDCFLNYLVDDADHNVAGTACNLVVNGTITLTWINLGDY